MLPLGSIFYAFLRPKTPFWKSNKGIKNAACNACIANDISSPSRDHRKKSLIFGGNPNYKFGNFAPQNSVLKSNKGIKNAACNACIANDTSSLSRGSPEKIFDFWR